MGLQPHDGHIEGHWKGKTHVANSPLFRAGFVAPAGDFRLRPVVACASENLEVDQAARQYHSEYRRTVCNSGYATDRLAVGVSRTSRRCRTAAL